MRPRSSPPDSDDAGTDPDGAEIIVTAPAWRRAVPRAELIAARAARAAGVAATIVLSDDRAVRRLNARHRGIDRATNVLSFEPAGPGMPGELVLALGTVRREAAASGRRPGDHLAHLVVHGCLHLLGHDHQQAGEARAMEQAEARLLARIGVPNPWRGAR
jgi:probable rRNA maturation factor